MKYYRPKISSQVSGNKSDDNEVEGTNDAIPPPPPTTLPSKQQHKDDHRDIKEDHPVAQPLIDYNFSYISIF